ncbi:SCO family protein [Nocardiopsis sp. HNM0947]|uniref:SCO family protein n=1 Tax=Nocardiopsis coralli TaxID=2772213 RepID=A0ABR9P0X4_9ACTN|nr:SCO family protein [Nocardiopsis coralli]MBE2997483.1 SCO family protein [Nocardiopsis coralli]
MPTRTAAPLAALALIGLTACSASAEADHYLDLSDQPMPASAVELSTVDGRDWTFTDVADDRLTLLFFGYTSCPDVCPMTMAELNLALEEAEAESGDLYDVVMVTTDPARDTDEQLGTWLERFDPDFQGVRGDIDATVEAASDYGIPVEAPEETDGDYLVSHGERIAVLTPDGEAAGFIDDGTGSEDIAALLPDLAEDLL